MNGIKSDMLPLWFLPVPVGILYVNLLDSNLDSGTKSLILFGTIGLYLTGGRLLRMAQVWRRIRGDGIVP